MDGVDPRWEEWLDQRDGALRALGEPIVDCVQQQDTNWAVFHGCWDWHSAVHGVWALHALSGLLGDESYLDVADALLTPEAISDELALVENLQPFGERPYGYAWLLRLVLARADAGRSDTLPLGDAAAEHLVNWLDEMSPAEYPFVALANDYDSSPWAVVNLHRWAEANADEALVLRLQNFVREAILPFECSLDDEGDELANFFPPCLHRALVMLTVLPEAERVAFLDEWLPDVPELTPVTEPGSAHAAGLNFSRAWGLWAVFEATGDPRWRTLWLDHVQTHMAMPQYWREGYLDHSHWIPQFGVLAIAMSAE